MGFAGRRLEDIRTDHLNELQENDGNSLFGACADSVGQNRRMSPDIIRRDAMPYRQDDLSSLDLALRQTIQFLLGPVAREKGLGEDHYTVPTLGQSVVDPLAQTIAHVQLLLIEPDADAELRQELGEGPGERLPFL